MKHKRKIRTRKHIIASLSANFVERFVLKSGHVVEKFENDYGYDLQVYTFNSNGEYENGVIYVQLKATDKLKLSGENPVYDFDIDLYINEPMPVVLILYDAKYEEAYWNILQDVVEVDEFYDLEHSTMRVKFPTKHKVDIDSVDFWQDKKNKILKEFGGWA